MKTIQIGGTAVAVREAGSGIPVVLLHCTGSSSSQWRAMAEALLAGPLAAAPGGRGYRLIMPDLRGYGASDPWSGRGPMRLADEAAIVRALVMNPADRPIGDSDFFWPESSRKNSGTLKDIEAQAIRLALHEEKTREEAARRLGIAPSTLYEKIKKYNL